MLFTKPLDHILGQASKVVILRFLFTVDSEFNGSEIAAAVGLSHVKCHTALKEMNQHGVVKLRHSGRSILYRLNLENLLVTKILMPLFENEARLKEMLMVIIAKHLKRPVPRSVILFGSFASGRAKPDSDIDILVVASKKKDIPGFKDGLEKIEGEITSGFGNHFAPAVMDAKEFGERFKNKDRLIVRIAREGKVLFGDSINDLIIYDDKGN